MAAGLYGISRLDVDLLGVLHAVDRNGGMSFIMESGPEETGYLCPMQNDRLSPYFGVRILTDQIDVHFVKICISHCRGNHDQDEACNINKGRTRMSAEARHHIQQSTYESDPRDTSDSPFSSRFSRLIDCTKQAIVEAQADSPYIALSYVWGSSENFSSSVPDDVPNGHRCFKTSRKQSKTVLKQLCHLVCSTCRLTDIISTSLMSKLKRTKSRE